MDGGHGENYIILFSILTEYIDNQYFHIQGILPCHFLKAFSLTNTTDGGESLITKLNAHIKSTADVEIRLEATGHYWFPNI